MFVVIRVSYFWSSFACLAKLANWFSTITSSAYGMTRTERLHVPKVILIDRSILRLEPQNKFPLAVIGGYITDDSAGIWTSDVSNGLPWDFCLLCNSKYQFNLTNQQ